MANRYEASPSGRCQHPVCKRKISDRRLKNRARYCSQQCKDQAAAARQEERKRPLKRILMEGELPIPTKASRRQGAVFQRFLEKPELADWITRGTVPQSYVAQVLGTSEAEVSRAYAAFKMQERLDISANEWSRSRLTCAMLPVEVLEELKALGPEGEDTDRFQKLLDVAVRAYTVFSRRFFTLEGDRPLIEPFHQKWIRAIITAFAVGGKQLILSPPRHGKSEMLIRFCVWLIVMDPNIRLMWVAANQDVAELMIGAVKDHLTNNVELVRATLPPGDGYRPDRESGRPWSKSEIKVRQMNIVGQKSSTMLGLGRDSEILSRDLDGLIVDDLESLKSTREPAQRRRSKGTFAEIGTRKEEKSFWIDICSRQHPDDVPNALMSANDSQAWRIMVDTAHTDCDLDPDIIDGHDENGCMLFPEVRSYRWLMEKKEEMDALGIPGAFDMRYLNKPVPETGLVFFVDTIREHLDRSRDLGIEGLPPGTLVAGLDPAARATQAAFCWHWTNPSLSMVDLVTQEAGGFAGAHKIMRQWHGAYGLLYWFYEDNSQQIEFFKDPRTTQLANELGLIIKPTTTGMNKQDPELGISSMAPWFHDGTIILPYGTHAARTKVNAYLRQLEMWTTDGVLRGSKRKSDIKMASWFPFPTIIKWRAQDRTLEVRENPESSYPGISSFQQAPWNETRYPGG